MHRAAAVLILVAAPAALAAQIQPGQWQITSTVTSIDMPGAPPGLAAMLKGKPMSVSHCLTPEQAKTGPQELMKSNKQCRFTRYSMANGKLDSAMTCAMNGSTVTTISTGRYTPVSFSSTGTSVATGSQPMRTTVAVAGRRVGACK